MNRAALLLLVAAMACGQREQHAIAASSTPVVSVGKTVPPYSAQTLTGREVRIGDKGEAIVLLNVWATWCASCREEMADLESLHRSYPTTRVEVIAVSLDAGSTELVRRFVQREQLSFAVVHDREARLQSAFSVAGVPSTYVIARDGRLLWQHTGGLHGAMDDARRTIDSALKNASSHGPAALHDVENRPVLSRSATLRSDRHCSHAAPACSWPTRPSRSSAATSR